MVNSAEESPRQEAFGWAAKDSSGVLSPFNFSRRANGDNDITLDILYCGICHSDLHSIKDEFGMAVYPLVPGHEIAGIVTEVGKNVTRFNVGDRAGVGCMVRSCHSCSSCTDDLENQCSKMVFSFGAVDYDGTRTQGGYSNKIVVDEHFGVNIPDNIALDGVAPLLCAGITMYSPLKYYELNKPGMHVGVVGLGGLGHMAVKFAKAFALKVTVISTSASKKKEAIERLGVDEFLISSDPEQMQAAMGTLDGILDTVSVSHPLLPLLGLLKNNGKLVLVGAANKPMDLHSFALIMGRKIIGGSCIGGMKETQEMINFAAEHNVTADIEVIAMDYVNTAMERLAKGDVRYRFVIDVGNTLKSS